MNNLSVIVVAFFVIFFATASATDFSRSSVDRINVDKFAEENKEGHIMPPPTFFLQQLKNLCHEYEHDALVYFLCSHLTNGQRYVVPILDYHDDEEKNDHVFMLELLPRKVYYHGDSPVAITTVADSLDQELQVLVPKQHVPADRLTSLAEELAKTAR